MWTRILPTILLAASVLTAAPAGVAAPDDPEAVVQTSDTTSNAHSPRGALWRAAALPGWGQFYNDQYLKIPVLYGALGGVTALALTFNRHYLIYRHAYLYQAYEQRVQDGTVEEHPYPEYEEDHARLIARTGDLSTGVLREQRDKLRRNRDLSYISIGLVYGLSIVDAYVSAHLADFEVSDDLAVQVRPGINRWSLRVTW